MIDIYLLFALGINHPLLLNPETSSSLNATFLSYQVQHKNSFFFLCLNDFTRFFLNETATVINQD